MIEVHTTVPDVDSAEEIAFELVDAGYAACVNYHEIRSVYRWEGETVEESEYAVDVKTSRDFEEVRRAVEDIHPYDVPAVIRRKSEANDDYEDWVDRNS